MVKRLLVILLLLVHTAASSGMVLSAHYCMGSLASVSIGHKERSKCAKCGMEDKGCCHDDQKLIKLDNSHLILSANIDFKVDVPVVADHHLTFFEELHATKISNSLNSFEPFKTPPIYLRVCNFRI